MIISHLKDYRLSQGLSQAKLAEMAQISLPTIQNIEAGKANPTIDILEKIYQSLGLALTLATPPLDINKAIFLGVPLSGNTTIKGLANQSELLREIPFWIGYFSSHQTEERSQEALVATLMAIHDHYPGLLSHYKKHSMLYRLIEMGRDQGRIIKLKKIALAKLSQYL